MINKYSNKQYYFYLQPQEVDGLMQFLHEKNITMFEQYSNSEYPQKYDWNVEGGIGKILLTLDHLKNKIQMKKIKEDLYMIDEMVSPLIEISTCRYREKVTTQGRISFRNGYMGRESFFTFPNELQSCFKEIWNFLTNNMLTKDKVFSGYVSKMTKEFVNSGGKLLQF